MTNILNWNESLRTGIDIIDDDHHFAVDLLNSFSDMEEGAIRSTQGEAAIQALTEYVENHFRREEAIMMVCGYAGRRQHEREHEAFRQVVIAVNRLYGIQPQLVNFRELHQFISQWFHNHITVTDRGYANHVLKNRNILDAISENLRDNENFSL